MSEPITFINVIDVDRSKRQELIDLLRLARPRRVEAGAPDRDDRRKLRRLKEGEG